MKFQIDKLYYIGNIRQQTEFLFQMHAKYVAIEHLVQLANYLTGRFNYTPVAISVLKILHE